MAKGLPLACRPLDRVPIFLRTLGLMHDLLRLTEVRAACRSGIARQIRVAAGISQSELAAAVGVDESTISRWEDGERTPRTAAALVYADALDQLQAATSRLAVSA